MSETLGRYRLLKLLATGGMGEVFLARQEGPAGFTKTLVIKRILRHLASDQGFIDLFLNEARLAAQLQHPNIAHVFGLESEANSWFIAMEYVHGRSLRSVISEAKAQGLKVPPRIAARLASQALQGLHYAHELTDERGRALGILHRDVSPENLLCAFSGSVKLVDFGIAKAMSNAVTRVGTPKGKVVYMAPELVVPGATVDRRADVFAVGVVLAEALLLEPPANSPTSSDEARGPRAPFTPHASVPEGLNAILVKGMAPKPDDRFVDAAAMSTALENWLVETSQPVSPGDVTGFLVGLFGQQALANDGVVIADESLTTGVLSNRKGGTQPLSYPAIPPVALPQEVPPARGSLWVPIVVGAATAFLVGFVLLLALWPKAQAPEEIPLVQVGPLDMVIPELLVEPPPPVPSDAGEIVVEAPPVVVPVKRSAAKKPIARTGRVTVRVNPWAEVVYGNKVLGTTPLPPVEVPAGNVTFTLKNKQLGVTRKVSVKVPPGGNVVLKADLFKK
ncbi:MAG: serine/threonine protein kinase [Archangium sp.]